VLGALDACAAAAGEAAGVEIEVPVVDGVLVAGVGV
jgi:hypothetical protein